MAEIRYKLTLKSSNAKTGPIPVSISGKQTCWDGCPFYGQACYAEGWPLRLHWEDVTDRKSGVPFLDFVAQVAALPDGVLWRHNQAGDLPGEGAIIDPIALGLLTAANAGKRGFTYTHKPLTKFNLEAIRAANNGGFVVNISANSASEAAAIKKQHPDLPVACVLPHDHEAKRIDVDGVAVVTCPATLRDDIQCATCGLCQRQDRPYVVGFPAHGAKKKAASAIAAL